MEKRTMDEQTRSGSLTSTVIVALAATLFVALLTMSHTAASAGEVVTCGDQSHPACDDDDDDDEPIADDTGGPPTTGTPGPPPDFDPGSSGGTTTTTAGPDGDEASADDEFDEAMAKIDNYLLEALHHCNWEVELEEPASASGWIGWAQFDGERRTLELISGENTGGSLEEAVADAVADAIDIEFLTDWDRLMWNHIRGGEDVEPEKMLTPRLWPGSDDYQNAFQQRMLGYTNHAFTPMNLLQEDQLTEMLSVARDHCRDLEG